ncbi:hypothetical protein SCLCIDRAFT_7324 [Scleroderma citrinum Foug A]|uniref:Uncharacterized protein n=1 Tax=Scleroderma citrinum Foug A TaxID=1036808 RepID=A0A0C3A1Y8_9AGAM|nr:hypothetical protein SCLCIDRAFT_7324 [Scleroderma citrinum Foug A]
MSSSSYTPDTDLWLERSRLSGVILAAVSYGCDSYPPPKKGCIDWRPTSPVASGLPLCHICLGHDRIFGEREVHRDNMDRFAQRTGRASCFDPRRIELLDQYYGDVLFSYCVMQWFMQALLFYLCFVIFGGKKYVVIPMGVLFLAMVGRLLIHRRQMEGLVSKEHLRTCGEVMTMVVESAAPSSILSIIFIISFALHSYICNLVFLAISHVQGIAQLFILIRVAQGRAINSQTLSSRNRPEIIAIIAGKPEDSVSFQGSHGPESISWNKSKSEGEA